MPSPAHAETWGWHLSLLSSPTPPTSAASSVKDSGGFSCPPSFLQFQPAHICSPTASVLPEKLAILPCPCFNILSTLFCLCSHPPTFLVCPALFMSPVSPALMFYLPPDTPPKLLNSQFCPAWLISVHVSHPCPALHPQSLQIHLAPSLPHPLVASTMS